MGDLDLNFGFAHSMLGLAYLRKGTPDRAVAHVQKARALSGTRPDVIGMGPRELKCRASFGSSTVD